MRLKKREWQLVCNIDAISRLECVPAMPHIIANKHGLYRSLTPTQRIRAIVVLIFVAAVMLLLMKFPGPLFQKIAKAPRFSPDSAQTLPLDANGRASDLNRRAIDALAELKAKSGRVNNGR
jgi:hypothetical protein